MFEKKGLEEKQKQEERERIGKEMAEYKQIDKFIVCQNKLLGQGAFGKVVKGFLKDNHA